MDISKLSVVELESMAYKQVVLLNQTQKNIQILEAEIAKRNEQPKAE
jgi:hypothetical protein